VDSIESRPRRTTARQFVAAVLLLGLTAACSDDAPVRPVGAVPASVFVQAASDVRGYEVHLLENGRDVTLDLLGERGRPLGTLTVVEVFDAADPARDGSLLATLQTPDAPTLRLQTRGVREGRGYRNLMTLDDDRGSRVDIEAQFDFRQCYDGAVDDAAGPACVGDLDLRRPVYSVPDCGPPRLALERAGIATALRSLRYRVPSPATLPDTGGARYAGGELVAAQLEVLTRDSGLMPTSEVSRWLVQSGGDAVIGSAAERRLSSVVLDRSWRDEANRLILARAGADAKHCGVGKNGLAVLAKSGNCPDGNWLDGANQFFGFGWGDPHFGNYYGTAFDYQGAGEYLLARSDGEDGFVLQGRFEPNSGVPAAAACANVSITTALALQIGGTRIGFYPGTSDPLRVDGDGVAGPAQLAALLPEGVSLGIDGALHAFEWADGTTLRISNRVPLRYELVPTAARRGRIDGLIGYFGLSDNDSFRTRDGRTLPSPPTATMLYGDYAESWRIDAGESLFDYGPGQSSASFQNRNFPSSAPGAAEDLPPALRAQGEQVCADVEGDPQRRWCVLDAVCLGPAIVADAQVLPPVVRDLADEDGVLLAGALRRDLPARVDTVPPTSDSCALPAPLDSAMFREQRGRVLDAAVDVDLAAPGELTGVSGGRIAAGSRVDSYFLNLLPPVGAPAQSGTLRFSRPILGLAATPATLAQSDALGRDGVAYPGTADAIAPTRGIEIGRDRVSISDDRRELHFELATDPGLDQIRVFVEALP
jgi:hypothetical protein